MSKRFLSATLFRLVLPVVLILAAMLAQATPARADGGWVPSISGPNGTVYAIVVVPSGGYCSGSNCSGRIYVGGSFSSVGAVPANNVAYYEYGQWYAVGSGTNGTVYALGWGSDKLYAGGSFSQAGGVAVTNFAVWNHSAWSSPASTVNGVINSISSYGNRYLLIGGNFSSPVYGIGVYDASASGWSEADLGPASNTQAVSFLPDGSHKFWSYYNGSAYRIQFKSPGGQDSLGRADINGPVKAIASSGSNGAYQVYVGGSFSQYAARFNGSGWSAMTGLDGEVYALAVGADDYVYAGGSFTGGIKRWAGPYGSVWESLGSGVSGGAVRAIADNIGGYAGNYSVGGAFTSAGGNSVSRFAILDRRAPEKPNSILGGSWPGSTDGWTSNSTPSFSWYSGGEFGPQYASGWVAAAQHDYYWGTDIACLSVTGSTPSASWSTGAQASGTTWYFCVRSRDIVGNVSAWTASEMWRYDGNAPSVPGSATGGATWQNSSSTPSFAWTASTDTGGSGLAGYYVYWGPDPNGATHNIGGSYRTVASWSPGAQASGTSNYLRVAAVDKATPRNASGWTTAVLWQYDNQAPGTPTGVTGGATWQRASNTPSFSWTAPTDTGGSGMNHYHVYWGTSLTGTATTDNVGVSYSPGAQASGTSNYFRVAAVDTAGNEGAWTTAVLWQYDTTSPSVPANVTGGATWQRTNNYPSFGWSVSTDTGGSGLAGYDVYWGTGASCGSFTAQTTYLYYEPGAQATGTSKYFCARSRDNAGNVSAWTTAVVWQYDGSVPSDPAGLSGGTTWQNSSNTPSFAWTASTDTGGSGLAGYDVYWGTDQFGSSVTAQPATNSWSPGAQASGTSQYFRVRSRDNAGNVSSWTTAVVWQYETSAPTLPGNVTGGTAWQNTNNTPSFNWLSSSDTGGSSLAGYDVYWGAGASCGSVFAQPTYSPWSPGAQAGGTSKYFCVRARDGAGNVSAWTTAVVWQYEINAPTLPSNVAGGATWQNTSNTPSFTWTASTDAGGSGLAGYDVYWGADQYGSSATDTTVNPSYLPGPQGGQPSGSAQYFRVRSRDNAGNTSAWTTAAAWQYETSSPTLPGNVTGGTTWQRVSNTPSFGWSASTDAGGSGLAGYDVYVGADPDGTTPTDMATNSPYSPGAKASGTSVYFRARSRDNAGNTSGWTTAVLWQYDGSAPSVPGSVTGGQTWQNTNGTPAFAWITSTDSGGSGLSGYEMYWGGSTSCGSATAQITATAYSPGPQGGQPSGTSQYFCARATDNAGNVSAWSSPALWQYDIESPSQPFGVTGGATWQRISNAPAFGWSVPFDADGSGLAGYEVYWGDDPNAITATASTVSASYSPSAQPSGSSLYFRVRAQDRAGNVSAWTTAVLWQYDGITPNLSFNPIWTPSTWYSSSVTLDASGSDSQSGMDAIILDGQTFPGDSGSKTISRAVSGVYTITGKARDVAGNEQIASALYRVDLTAPGVVITPSWTPSTWYSYPVTLNAMASDAHAGLASVTLDGALYPATTTSGLAASQVISRASSGLYTLYVTAQDNVGWTQTLNTTYRFDVTRPDLQLYPAWTPTVWYSQPVVLNATANDAHAGVQSITLDGYMTNGPSASQVISRGETGVYTIDGLAVDNAGNTQAGATTYRLDMTLPDIAVTPSWTPTAWYSQPVSLTASASDAHSGMGTIILDGQTFAGDSANASIARAVSGVYTITGLARDVAGNERPIAPVTYQLDLAQPDIALTPGWTPTAWYSQPVTLEAAATDAPEVMGAPASGIAWLTLDGETFGSPAASKVISRATSGVYVIDGATGDAAGWTRAATATYKLDVTAPFFSVLSSTQGLASDACQTLYPQPGFTWAVGDAHSGVASVAVQSSLGTVQLGASGTTYVLYDGNSVTDTVRFVVTDSVGWERVWEFHHCYVNPSQPGAGQPTTPGVVVTPSVGTGWVKESPTIQPDGGGYVLGHNSLSRYYLQVYRQTLQGDWIEAEAWYRYPGESFTPSDNWAGAYRVRVSALAQLDGAEVASAAVTVTYQIDNVVPPAPAPLIGGLEGGEWTNSRTTITATWPPVADPHSGLSHYLVCLGDAACAPTTIISSTHPAYTADAPSSDGEYTLRVQAVDRAGNTSPVGAALYRLDTTAPGLTHTTSAAISTTGAVSLLWLSADNLSGLNRHALTITDMATGQVVTSTQAPGAAQSWTAALADGRYQAALTAHDNAGNASAPATWNVRVDSAPPTLVSGSIDSIAQSRLFTATAIFTDATGLAPIYTWRFDVLTETTTLTPTWIAYVGTTPNGVYTIEVQATDAMGNTSGWTALGQKVFDVVPPAIAVFTPTLTAPARGMTADPTLTFAPDADTRSYNIAIAPRQTIKVYAPPLAATLPITTSGVYTVSVSACDVYENCAPARAITLPVDLAAPTILNSVGPWDNTTTRLIFTPVISDDLDSAPMRWYCLTSGPACTPDQPMFADSVSWDVTASGIYTMHVRARDAVGHTSFGYVVRRVDFEAPVIAGLRSNAAAWQRMAATAEFDWTASDASSGLAALLVSFNGITASLPVSSSRWIAPSMLPDSEGERLLTLRAIDQVGYSTMAQAIFRYDGKAPVISTTTAIGEAWQSQSDQANVLVNVGEAGSGLKASRYCLAFGAAGCVPTDNLISGQSVVLSAGSEVTATLVISAQDFVDNLATVTRLLRFDNTPPRLSLSGVPTLTAASGITATSAVTDVALASVQLSLIGAGGATIASCAATGACFLALPGDGSYTVRLTATDAAGNTSALERPVRRSASSSVVVYLTAPISVSVADGTLAVSLDASGGSTWQLYVNGALVGSGVGSSAHVPVTVPATPGTLALRAQVSDSFGATSSADKTVQVVADLDGDGIPDLWEKNFGLDWRAGADAEADPDGDGLTNREEYVAETNPHNPDSDGDGLADGVEVHVYRCANPTQSDTDGDGRDDGWEAANGYDPCTPTVWGTQVALEFSPRQQSIAANGMADLYARVTNLAPVESVITVTITLTGGASLPRAAETGWTVYAGVATQAITVPGNRVSALAVGAASPANTRSLSVTLLCPSTGRFVIGTQAQDAATSSVVDVLDVAQVTLSDLSYPVAVLPGDRISITGAIHNAGETAVVGARLRVTVGMDTREELHDLNALSVVYFATIYTAPMTVGAVPVSVTVVGAYHVGQIFVVEPQLAVASSCDPAQVPLNVSARCVYTLTNIGTRSGDLVAQVNWPSGVQLAVSSTSGGATATVSGQAIAIARPNLAVGGQVVVVASATPTAAGIYRPTLSVAQGWAMASSALAGIYTQGASQYRVYLPLVTK